MQCGLPSREKYKMSHTLASVTVKRGSNDEIVGINIHTNTPTHVLIILEIFVKIEVSWKCRYQDNTMEQLIVFRICF